MPAIADPGPQSSALLDLYAEKGPATLWPRDTWDKPHAATLRRLHEVSFMATLAAFVDMVRTVIADDERLEKEIEEQQAVIDSLTVTMKEATAAAAATQERGEETLIDAQRRLYMPTAAFRLRPEISGKIVLTPLAITLLDQAEIECQRLEPRITREVLTGPQFPRLRSAFADLMAAYEQRNTIRHPSQYKKDKEFPFAIVTLQDARAQMLQVLKLWRSGALPGAARKGGGGGRRKPLIY